MRTTSFIQAAIILVAASLIAACGRGQSADAPAGAATSAPATAAPTSAPAEPAATEPAATEPAATETPASVEAAPTASAPTGSTPTESAPADGEASGEALDALDSATFTTVEQAASINTYRMNVSMTSQRSADAPADVVVIQGAFVKQPPAQRVLSQFRESSGRETTIEILVVDGTTYLRSGDQWIQATETAPFNLAEVTLITPDAFADAESNFTVIGNETVNGRETIHYQGDKNSLPRVDGEGDIFDPEALSSADVHIWADAEERFVVRLLLSAEATDGQGNTSTIQLAHEYTDFNADITIQAPEGATSIDPPPVAAEGSFATNLGFDLTLPENSTVQFFGGGRIAAITVPLTLDEAIAFFQGAMEANGYTLASTVNTSATELVHTYQKDAKTVVATIFITGSGGTSINLGGG